MRWIAANAGHEASLVVQRVKEMTGDEGFNALTERYDDLVAARAGVGRTAEQPVACEPVRATPSPPLPTGWPSVRISLASPFLASLLSTT